MMKKVVESAVLKRMAGITGLVTAEEMGTDTIRYIENPNKNKPLSSAGDDKPKSALNKPKSRATDEEAVNDVVQDADFQVKTQTTTESDETSTEAQVDEPETLDFKALSKKSEAFKKVCDALNRGGFDLDANTIYVEAGSMNQRKDSKGKQLLTDKELDEVEVLLGKKPA
jgi:hypothetical protein